MNHNRLLEYLRLIKSSWSSDMSHRHDKHNSKRVLFICKYRPHISYGEGTYGLKNSALFVSLALQRKGIESKVVTVIDNNCIDREVYNYQPTHVIIEAFWVVPEKFHILCQKYPNIKWVVRSHSKIPFIANEGVAMDWTARYLEISFIYDNFALSGNTNEFVYDVNYVYNNQDYQKAFLLPNIYDRRDIPVPPHNARTNDVIRFRRYNTEVHIGCFGASRPLKNQLKQAIAAIEFARDRRLTLFFHINGTRSEQNGDNVLKNLRALFQHTPHVLVEHAWMSHNDFLRVISDMDIGMQVSFTETFNIVTADFVNVGVPIVVSPEIEWMPLITKANPTDSLHMVSRLNSAWRFSSLFRYLSRAALDANAIQATMVWEDYIRLSKRALVL